MTKPSRDLKLALEEYSLTEEELDDFLTGQPRFATIGSLRKTGAPIIDGIGYEWDGECMYFSVRGTRALLKRLRRDARVCLHVMNTEYPVVWVRLEGVAEPIDDEGFERTLRIMRKNMEADSELQALDQIDIDAFSRSYLEFGRQLFRLRPERLHSHDAAKQAARFDLATGRLKDEGSD